MNGYYLEVLDDALTDIDLCNAIFTESNMTEYMNTLKNAFMNLQIKVKEYTILQNVKVTSKDNKVITKYQKGIEDRIDHLLSMKSKNINNVECYNYSKVRTMFPNMLTSLNSTIEANILKSYESKADIDGALKGFDTMVSDFNSMLESISMSTILNVDTAIRILWDSDGNKDSVKNLSTMFSALNKLLACPTVICFSDSIFLTDSGSSNNRIILAT